MHLIDSFTYYLNSRYNQLSKQTINNYRADVSRFIKWYDNKFNLPLTTNPSWVNIQTILDLYKKEKTQNYSLSTASLKRHFSSIRKLFEFLEKEGLISQNPFKTKTLSTKLLGKNDKSHVERFTKHLLKNNKSKHTIKNYIFDIQRFLTWAEKLVGENTFGKIDDHLLSEYKNSLLKKGLSVRSIKRNFSSIQNYLDWIKKDGLSEIPNIPAKGWSVSGGKRQKPNVPTTPKQPSATEQASKRYPRPASPGLVRKTIDAFNYTMHKIKGKPMFKDIPSVTYELKIRGLLPEPRPTPEVTTYETDLGWDKKLFLLSLMILSLFIMLFALYQNLKPDQKRLVTILSFKVDLTDYSRNLINQVNDLLQIAIYHKARIMSSKIISPIASTDRIHTNILSPLIKR